MPRISRKPQHNFDHNGPCNSARDDGAGNDYDLSCCTQRDAIYNDAIYNVARNGSTWCNCSTANRRGCITD